MPEVTVLARTKLLRGNTTVCKKNYAIAFDAADDAIAAALIQRLRRKEAFAGLSLGVDSVTVLNHDFNEQVEVERGDRLTNKGEYIVTFIEASNEQVERAVASPPHVVQVRERREIA